MKTSNHSGEEKRNMNCLYRPSSSLAETAVFATLGLVGFVAVVIAVVSSSVPAGSKEDPLADLGRSPMARYVVSGPLGRRLSGHEHKHDDIRRAQCGLWPGPRRALCFLDREPGRLTRVFRASDT